MPYAITTTRRFEKDLRRCIKRGLPMAQFKEVLLLLEHDGTLPVRYKPHKLHGNRHNVWECHIQPNWLLVWQQDDNTLTLLLLNTGSHADIFG